MEMALPDGEILRRGAEAVLVRGSWLGRDAVYKVREIKAYRHPDLDARIRSERTASEARIIGSLVQAGLPVPCLYDVDLHAATIVMEYIPGRRLKDVVPTLETNVLHAILHRLGETIAAMHGIGLIHGDLTTSNVIIENEAGPGSIEFRVIDFGLSRHSESIEDRSVDLHLFKRVVTSTHASAFDDLFPPFMDGYRAWMEDARKSDQFRQIETRMRGIEIRGRYVQKKERQ
jgi:Kae1-associated kinase Bud32